MRRSVDRVTSAYQRQTVDDIQAGVCVLCTGVIGDWLNYFTADLEAEISECCIEPLQRRSLTFTDSDRRH